jgi:hypothetical protein
MVESDFSVSQRLQDGFLLLCITDSKFLSICRKSISPHYFSSKVTEDLIKVCYSYFDQFAVAPADHFHDEVERTLNNKPEQEQDRYVKYLERLQVIRIPNKDYIISRVNSFVQAREFEQAAVKFADLASKGEFVKAKELMQSALRSGISSINAGIDYFNVEIPSYYDIEGADGQRKFLMHFGFSVIDERYLRGCCRTDLVGILGFGKGCKTWMLMHLGREAIYKGLNVLYITHEVSAEDLEQRFDKMFGAMTQYPDMKETTIRTYDEFGNQISDERVKVDCVFDKEATLKVRKTIGKFGGKLRIMKYPMGTATMGELERYLDSIESYEGYIPDVVINDYPEKMKVESGDHRNDAIHQIYVDSKRLADERKILWLTASQTNRAGYNKKIPDEGDTAEDIRKIDTVDLMLAITQTKRQAKKDLRNAYVLVNRHGPQKFGCTFWQNLDIGQPVLSTWNLKSEKGDNDEEDED